MAAPPPDRSSGCVTTKEILNRAGLLTEPRTDVERSARREEIYQMLGERSTALTKARQDVLVLLIDAYPEHAINKLLFFVVCEVKNSPYVLNADNPDMEAAKTIVRLTSSGT